MGTVELRCDGTLHGKLQDGKYLEVKCDRRKCGYRRGIIILHTIDITTGELISTKTYAEPKPRKEGHNASHHSPASVRAS